MLIGAIYRSPNSNVANSRQLIELINTAVGLKYDYTVLVGDFNYPNINWKDWTTPFNHTHPEFQFIECLRDNFMNQYISKPTRYREGQTANILDLFIVDKSEIVSKITYASNLGSSDHACFITELKCKLLSKDTKTIKRNFYKGDYVSIREDLRTVEWNSMDEMNVEDSWNFFIDKISNSTEKHVPLHQENMSVKCIPPHTPLLYSKNGVCRGIPIFLIFAPKHRLWVLVRTASLRRF